MKLYNDTEDTFTLCPSNFLRTIRAIAASSQTRNVEEAIGEKQRFDLFCSLDRTDKKKLIQIFLLPLLVPPLTLRILPKTYNSGKKTRAERTVPRSQRSWNLSASKSCSQLRGLSLSLIKS